MLRCKGRPFRQRDRRRERLSFSFTPRVHSVTITAFLDAASTKSAGFLFTLTSFDMTTNGANYKITGQGTVFSDKMKKFFPCASRRGHRDTRYGLSWHPYRHVFRGRSTIFSLRSTAHLVLPHRRARPSLISTGAAKLDLRGLVNATASSYTLSGHDDGISTSTE